MNDEYDVKFVEQETGSYEGKYILVREKDSRKLLFIGTSQEGIGGHSDILCLFFDATRGCIREEDKYLKYGRTDLIEALKAFKGVQLNNMDDTEGGGKYLIQEGKIKIFGKSTDFGAPKKEIIEQFKEPLKKYFLAKGNSLEVIIDND